MSPDEAVDEIRKYLECEHIYKIYPTPTTWPILLSLLGQHPVTGQDIHDLHLDPEAINFIENQEDDEDLEQEYKEEPEDNETAQQGN